MSEAPTPTRFGKYTLLRRLAEGGMAEIFLAMQRTPLVGGDSRGAMFEKLLVIKRVLPQLSGDKQFADMLLHEAQIAATLNHPNLVHVFDAGAIDGRSFIAMEWIHGEDLRAIVRQMKKKELLDFPLEHAIAIVLGACAGLAYAHEKRGLDGARLGIVHRDVSPQNVVVTFGGDVKLVDFGIARSEARRLQEDTKSGKLKGKVPYMSPEQCRGEPLDARSDLFSLGTLLFELTTGKRLFKGQSEFETLKLICDRDYPRPSAVKPGYPPALERIVMRALSKDRDARYTSGRDLQVDLEAFVREEKLAVSRLALESFMRRLFSEQLAREEQALRDGKKLADAIELPLMETSNALDLSAIQRISRVHGSAQVSTRSSQLVLLLAAATAIVAALVALILAR